MIIRRKPKAQATRLRQSIQPKPKLPKSIHLLAVAVAVIITTLAFGLPLERANKVLTASGLSLGPDSETTLNTLTERELELPVVSETTLYQPPPLAIPQAWQTARVEPGDNLTGIFDRLGLQADDLYSLLESCSEEAKVLTKLHPGQVFKIRTDGEGDLVELVYAADKMRGTRIFRDGEIFKAAKYIHKIEKRQAYSVARIDKNFSQATRKVGLSKRISRQLINMFGHKINFNRAFRPGDAFTVLYEEDYFSGEKIGDGDILAAELRLRQTTLQAIGFRDSNGVMRYYSPDGQGIKPAFMRYPVKYSRISSEFQSRRMHPILRTKRAHRGIDLAAPRGTSVQAVGDGVIEFIGRRAGYGKTIVINHGRGYTTLYGHLNGYGKKLRRRSEVRKGQVIGYVGSTGLATGPHLHYEFRVNNVAKNPRTVSLPGDPPIPARRLAHFRRFVEPLVAQMELHHRTRVALNGQ